jgi:hypothetical protein
MRLAAYQIELDLFRDPVGISAPGIAGAIASLAIDGDVEARGAVFTRSEVVDFILDLAGYTPDQPPYQHRILEPSFGAGDFLLPIIERLLFAWQATSGNGDIVAALSPAIRGVELQSTWWTPRHFTAT